MTERQPQKRLLGVLMAILQARMGSGYKTLGFFIGLLLCLSVPAWAQPFVPVYARAYRLAFKLKTDSARLLAGNTATDPEQEAQRLLVLSMADLIENMVRETDDPLPNYFDKQDARIEALDDMRKPGPWARHALSECYLHKALMQGLYGSKLKGGLSFSKAYFKNKDLMRDHPAFVPGQKSEALYKLVISQVPDYGTWLAHLLGFSGDMDAGIEELRRCSLTPSAQQDEAILLYSLVLMYLQHQPEAGRALLAKYVNNQPDDLLGLTFLASAYKEAHQNDPALATMRLSRRDKGHLPFYFPLLLKGELYLQDLQTDSAIALLEQYVAVCSRQRLLKQAHYRLFTAYHIKGDSIAANRHFYAMGSEGMVGSDGDRYAQYFFDKGQIPDRRLLRARLLSDGGYNARACAVLDSIAPSSLHTLSEVTELAYRRARLAQRTKDTAAADRLFRLTISTAQQDPSYYAPMACIQLGEAALAHRQWQAAEDWFEKARTYPKHEYKKALDDRADAGLRRLRKYRKAFEKAAKKAAK